MGKTFRIHKTVDKVKNKLVTEIEQIYLFHCYIIGWFDYAKFMLELFIIITQHYATCKLKINLQFLTFKDFIWLAGIVYVYENLNLM